MKSALRVLLPFLICLAWSQAGAATIHGEIASIGDEKPEAVSLNLVEIESSYVLGSDLHRSASFGDQDAIQNSFSYAHRFPLNGHLYLHLGIDYSRFDFSQTGAPVPRHLQSVGLVIGIDYMHGNDVGAFIQVKPGIYTEENFDSAAFDAPITLGRIFVLQTDHLYLFAGANASFLRGRFPVVPLVGLIWMPNDKWKVVGLLPEPRVIYSPNDKFDFWAGGELTGGSFRTDHDNTIVPAKLNGAEVDYTEYRAGAGMVYSPCDNVSIDLGGGYSIRREFDFHRADIRYKADGAPYLRLEFKAKF
jgi:Opacity protein and related surface antigens